MAKVHKKTNIQKRKYKCPINMKGEHSHDNPIKPKMIFNISPLRIANFCKHNNSMDRRGYREIGTLTNF